MSYRKRRIAWHSQSRHTSQHFLAREVVSQKCKIKEGFGRAVSEVYWFNPHSWNMLWWRVYVPKLVISCMMLRSNIPLSWFHSHWSNRHGLPNIPILNCPLNFCVIQHSQQNFFFLGATAPSGPGPLHSQGFQITLNDARQSVGLLWTSDQPVAETSTWQHTTLTRYRHPCPRWDLNPQSQQARGRRNTP